MTDEKQFTLPVSKDSGRRHVNALMAAFRLASGGDVMIVAPTREQAEQFAADVQSVRDRMAVIRGEAE